MGKADRWDCSKNMRERERHNGKREKEREAAGLVGEVSGRVWRLLGYCPWGCCSDWLITASNLSYTGKSHTLI